MCACAVSQPSSPIECNESLRIATVELWKESSAPADRPSLFNIPVSPPCSTDVVKKQWQTLARRSVDTLWRYMCVYVCMCIYVCVCMCVYLCMYECYLCMYVCVCIYIYIYICVCMYVIYVYVCVCVFVSMCVCLCMYIWMLFMYVCL